MHYQALHDSIKAIISGVKTPLQAIQKIRYLE